LYVAEPGGTEANCEVGLFQVKLEWLSLLLEVDRVILADFARVLEKPCEWEQEKLDELL